MYNLLGSLTLFLAGFVWPMAMFGLETHAAPVQYLAQISTPRSAGGCRRGMDLPRIEECYRDVRWVAIPNSRTFVGGYDEGYAWIGSNTINRKGETINVDVHWQGIYMRLSANCKSMSYAIIAGRDTYVDPSKYYQANGNVYQHLSYACKLSK